MQKQTKLKEAREKTSLTQEQVVKEARISIRAYKMYESGERIPRADVAVRIAKIVRSTVEELF